ncbi:MAG TPA: hypothetical protein VMW27_31165 [Thermoanaerobaculia bacterium]|nr:hypothetical protein [Thermoanaerobaculia bacterium]
MRSPLSLPSLTSLLLAPTRFFASPAWLQKTPQIFLVLWLSRIAYTLKRIDKEIFRAGISKPRPGWEDLGPWLTESWLHYWAFALVLGALNGLIFWLLGGWWFRKRLEWSGVAQPDPALVRPVYMYQDLVASGPSVLIAIVETLVYANYAEAWNAEEVWSSTVLIFLFWSCFTSYKAAITAFGESSKWKARLWFLILPIMVYVFAIGALGVFYGFFGSSAT